MTELSVAVLLAVAFIGYAMLQIADALLRLAKPRTNTVNMAGPIKLHVVHAEPPESWQAPQEETNG